MKMKHKKSYITPVTDVVKVKQQGMLCTSPLRYSLDGELPGYENGGEDTWNNE